jgi:hypothetical protein
VFAGRRPAARGATVSYHNVRKRLVPSTGESGLFPPAGTAIDDLPSNATKPKKSHYFADHQQASQNAYPADVTNVNGREPQIVIQRVP